MLPKIVCSQTTLSGCRINNTVYIEYLGTGSPYNDTQIKDYYKVTGIQYQINNNNSRRYQCGEINDYPQGSYYDPTTNSNVTIPAQNEILSANNNGCITSTTAGGPISGQGGTYITFKIPTNCVQGPTASAPLDDYIIILLFGLTALSIMAVYQTVGLKCINLSIFG